MEEKPDLARELARKHYAAGDPLGWFESLYKEAAGDFGSIPWADRAVNPNLAVWCEREGVPRPGMRVLVVGCGLGDDAEYLAARGAAVTAFDLAPTAIAWCKERFPESAVDYQVANLFEFTGEYDLVVEIYTLQAMPLEMRERAVECVGRLGREVLIICRGREEKDPPGQLPFPLTRTDLKVLTDLGVSMVSFEDFEDPFDAGKRRFRAYFRR
jgi:SAM-dependent methyltransferase